jgi:hypothetical protein
LMKPVCNPSTKQQSANVLMVSLSTYAALIIYHACEIHHRLQLWGRLFSGASRLTSRGFASWPIMRGRGDSVRNPSNVTGGRWMSTARSPMHGKISATWRGRGAVREMFSTAMQPPCSQTGSSGLAPAHEPSAV